MNKLMLEGVRSEKPDMPVKVIEDEVEAIKFALKNAKKGELLVILPDNMPRAIELVSNYRDKLNSVKIEQSDIPNMNDS